MGLFRVGGGMVIFSSYIQILVINMLGLSRVFGRNGLSSPLIFKFQIPVINLMGYNNLMSIAIMR